MDIFKFTRLWILAIISILLHACNNSPQTKNDTKDHFVKNEIPDTKDTLKNLNIVWEKKEKRISHDVYFSEYGRVKRLNGDTLLLVYHCGTLKNEWDNIALRKSTDNGKTWLQAGIIVKDNKPERYNGFSTPDLLVLKNKWLVLSYAGRGKPDDSLHNNLQVRISKDQGKSWSDAQVVSLGRSWEPGMVQLPDGEIELFYSSEMTNSKKAQGRHEQKILMISSKDNGLSWSDAKPVAFLPHTRDGMPVPVLLKKNKGIIFLIEAVYNDQSPQILWSSLKAKWNYKEIGSLRNGRRWTASVDPIWGGAPSLVQLSTGETIICMQTELGRKIDRYNGWKKNSVVIMVGNSVAKNFGSLSFPYPNLSLNEGRYFNSLFLKNDSTVALITTRNLPSGRSVLYWKEGHIYRPKHL